MILYHTPTSPFVRKVLVSAHELGLADRLETRFLRAVPTKTDPALSGANPLSKIPALILEDGSALYDSAVICDYLDTLHQTPRLTPRSGPARFRVLRQQALCDGILEAAILVFYERTMRPAELQWRTWLDGQIEKANQGLDALEREAPGFGAEIDLGQICAGCALGWLELRGVLGDVRAKRPALAAWYEQFRARPSMKATEPPPS